MADDYTVISVPGQGMVRFPSSMTDDDIHDALVKIAPPPAAVKQQAQGAFESAVNPLISAPQNKALPSLLPTTPDKSVATPQGNAKRAAQASFEQFRAQGAKAAGMPLSAPRTAGEVGSPMDLIMSPSERMNAAVDNRPQSQARTELSDQLAGGTQAPALPGMLKYLPGVVGDWWKRNMQQGYLKPALDEAGQMVESLPYILGPHDLPGNIPKPTTHLGTETIPNALAYKPTEGLQPGDSKLMQAVKAVGNAGYETANQMTSPEMMGAALGFKVAPESLPAKAASTFWTSEMLKNVPGQTIQGVQKLTHGDVYHGVSDLASAAIGARFGAEGLLHLGGVPERATPSEKPANPVAPAPVERPVAAEKPQTTVPGEPSDKLNDLLAEYHDAITAHGPVEETEDGKPIIKAEFEPRISSAFHATLKQFRAEFPDASGQTLAEFFNGSGRFAPSLEEVGAPQTKPEPTVAPPAPVEAKPEGTLQIKQEEPQAAKPSVQETPTQTQSIVPLEDKIRSLIGNVLGIRQLQSAATERLNVEKALRAATSSRVRGGVKGDEAANAILEKANSNSIADSTKSYKELNTEQQAIVTSVAKALGKPVVQLENSGWQLTADDVKTLKSMRSQGLRPLSIAGTGHPVEPFLDQVPYPLADINEQNAKAVGIGNAKKLWSQLSPADKLAHAKFKTKGFSSVGANEAGDLEGAQRGFDLSTGGKDVETLQHEHDMLQTVLDKRFKMARANLRDAVPAWRQARLAEGPPSKLSTDILNLPNELKGGIPKELYANEHLTAKTPTVTAADERQEPIPSAQTPKVRKAAKAPEGPSAEEIAAKTVFDARSKVAFSKNEQRVFDAGKGTAATKEDLVANLRGMQDKAADLEGEAGYKQALADARTAASLADRLEAAKEEPQAPKPSVQETPLTAKAMDQDKMLDHIVALTDQIQTAHGEEAYGAIPKILAEAEAKFQDPEHLNKAVALALQKYKTNLEGKVENPLESALDQTIRAYKGESATGSTFYANPIGAMFKRLFGGRQTPTGREEFPNFVGVLPDGPIADFTKAIGAQPPSSSYTQFKSFLGNETANFVKSWQEMPGNFKERSAALGNFFSKAWDLYKTRPGLSAIDLGMGLRQLHLVRSSIELQNFVQKINALHPNQMRRAAMSAWEEAGGGRLSEAEVSAKISAQAAELEGVQHVDRAKGALYKIYKAASDLTPQEKQTVTDYREYRAQMEQREAELGLSHEAKLDYIQHIWSRDNFVQATVKSLQSGRGFGTAANFQRMRTYEDYFSGIMNGLKPNNMDMTYLVTSRAMASSRVIANRELVDFLQKHTMPDGTKAVQIEGLGTHQEPNPTEADKQGAIYLNGRGLPKAAHTADERELPFVRINHGSFQNWKWVGTAEDGTQVLYKGSMVVHPDIATQLKRILEPSALRGETLGGSKALASIAQGLLKTSSVGKQTLLVGLFHPVQLGVHLLEHAAVGMTPGSNTFGTTSTRALRALNPFSTEKFLDMNDPKQQQLVMHGLVLREFNSEHLMDEGVMSQGFVRGLPYLGRMWGGIHDAIFTKMIPNMKMAMAQDVLERNMNRYHDTWKNQILQKALAPNEIASQEMQGHASIAAQSRIFRLTAEQVNAGFGGIDWSKMPVNKTMQDVLRLTVLAPDFLLARAQFVGDAFRPGGAESRTALGVGFGLQYVMARALNAAFNNGDAKTDIHDWNKLIIGHNEYSLRTVQGDLLDSILNTRQFLQHRINPLWRGPIEFVDQKDIYGHPITPGQLLVDTVKNFAPMPAQGAVDWAASKVNPAMRSTREADRIVDTIAQSMTGVMRKQYRSPAERIVYNAFDNLSGGAVNSPLAMEQKNTFKAMREAYREGKLTPEMIQKALNDPNGNLKRSELKYLKKTQKEPELKIRARQLPFDQVKDAWEHGTPMEKFELTPILRTKLKTLAPQVKQQQQQQLNQWLLKLPEGDQLKLYQQTRDELEWERQQQGEPTPAQVQQMQQENNQ